MPTTEEPKKVVEKVEVDKSTLTEILSKLENLEKKSASDDKTISKLLAVADKGRLANYELQHEPGSLIRTANISIWQGYRVLGWKTIKNEVDFINGILRETQTIRVFLLNSEDPKKEKHEDLELLNFNRHVMKEQGEVIKESVDRDGRKTYTLRLKDGMELDLDIAFIN